MATGICYTWSGSKKKYEHGIFSFSPDRVKFVGIDNYFVKPFIPYMFTSSNHPPEVSLEEGTAMYVVGVRNIDDSGIDLSTYLTYTPPDGYELVSEDHKYDTGVKEYHVSKEFYCEPFTVYYGTAGKTFSQSLTAGKDFYYKKKDKPVKPDTYINYYVTLTLNSGMLNCKCNSVTNIPGTNNGNVTFGINIELGDGVGGMEYIQFSWVMKNGINESKSCSMPYYAGSGFTTQSSWETDNGNGTKTYYTFRINHDSIPSRPNTKSL